MAHPTFDSVQVGDALPALQLAPVDRTTLALFGGASGDHNPIHIDTDFARRAGVPDVFAQGMLGMAWLGRLLTAWVPQSRLRRFDVRFAGVTHLGNAMRCEGRVLEKIKADGERCVRIEVRSTNQYGQSKIAGEAIVAGLSHRDLGAGAVDARDQRDIELTREAKQVGDALRGLGVVELEGLAGGQVGTGAKGLLARTGQHDGAQTAILVGGDQHLGQALQDHRADGVAARFAVDGEPQHAALLAAVQFGGFGCFVTHASGSLGWS